MKNRLKKLRLEKRLTLADVQVKTDIDFKILENFEKGLENGIPNSLAIWQKLANFLEVPVEYLMGLNDDSKTLTVNDLNPAEEAIASIKNSEPKNKSDKKSKNVGLLLEAVNDLANASAFNERDKKDKVSERLDSAGKNVTLFLVNELHVKPSDIAMFTILKTVLSEDDEDE